MSDTPTTPSDRDLDQLLEALSDALALPPMADCASLARQRIEARDATGRPLAQVTAAAPPDDDRAAAFQPREVLQLPLDEQRSKIREFALLAAGLAAAAILAVGLTFIFRGFGADDGDVGGPPLAEGPLAAEPYEIPGFEFVRSIGQPQVPNEPIDVAVGPDGVRYVLDAGLNRVVAFREDGTIEDEWGDRGFSERVFNATAMAIAPDGSVYVAVDSTILTIDSVGTVASSEELPDPPSEAGPASISDLTVNSVGTLFIVRSPEIWEYEARTGEFSLLTPDISNIVQLAIDAEDQIYLTTFEGNIRRLDSLVDGTTTSIAAGLSADLRSGQPGRIDGFTIDQDGALIAYLGSRSSEHESVIVRLTPDGEELGRWETAVRPPFGLSNTALIGLAADGSGSLIVPDPQLHQLLILDSSGEVVGRIIDDDPRSVGRLWHIGLDGMNNVYALGRSAEGQITVFDETGSFLRSTTLAPGSARISNNPLLSSGFTVLEDGRVVVADQTTNTITLYSVEGEIETTWGGALAFEGGAGLLFPRAVATDERETLYLVDESGNDNLRAFTLDGEYIGPLGSLPSDRFDLVYADGAVWTVDGERIIRFPIDGDESETIAATALGEGGGALPGLPYTLALDADGNIYTFMISVGPERGQFNGLLAKLDPDGDLLWATELADARDRYIDLAISDDGMLYLSDSEQRQILVYRPISETDGPAPTSTHADSGETEGSLLPVGSAPELANFEFTSYVGESAVPNEPSDALGTDNGRIFVSDRAFDRVVAFTQDGDVDTSWGAGGFSARIPAPVRLALDPDGELWAATFGGEIFHLEDPANPQLVWSLSGGGQIMGFAIDSGGRFYLANAADGELVRRSSDGSETILGTIPRDTTDLAIDSNDLLYLVTGSERGLIYDTDGTVVARWGNNGIDIEGLGQARGVAISPGGNIVLAQRTDDSDRGLEILTLSPEAEFIDSWQTQVDDTFISNIENASIGVDSDGRILIPDRVLQRIVVFDSDGEERGSLAADPAGRFAWLSSLTTGPDGDLYALDGIMKRAQRFSQDGELRATYDFSDLDRLSGVAQQYDLVVGDGGRVYITVYWNQHVAVFSPDGKRVDTFGNPGEVSFEDETTLFSPYGIDIADDDVLLLTDEQSAGYIKRFTTDGEYRGRWLATEENTLYVRFEASGDRVYVARRDGFDIFDPEGNLVGVIPYDGDVSSFDVDEAGYIHITGLLPREGRQSDALAFEFVMLGPKGNLIERADLGLSVQLPTIAVSGDGRNLYIASGLSRQIFTYQRADIVMMPEGADSTGSTQRTDAVPDLLVVRNPNAANGQPSHALVDPTTVDSIDLPAGEIVGIRSDGGMLLLIDQEPGDERLRLDVFAVSTETLAELWRTDIGERSESGPNTIYFDTVVSEDTAYVAIHDPAFRTDMLEIAEVRLSDGWMPQDGPVGIDTNVTLGDQGIDVDLLVSESESAPGPTILVTDRRSGELLAVGRERVVNFADFGLTDGTPHVLPDEKGLVVVPSSGFLPRPTVHYILFSDWMTREIPLPFRGGSAGGIVEFRLAHDGQRLFVVSPYDGQVAVVDLDTLSVEDTFDLAGVPPPASLSEVVESAAIAQLYGQHPVALSPDERFIYAFGTLQEWSDGVTPVLWKIDTVS